MPNLLHLLRYWTLLASLAIIFSVYFVIVDNSVEHHYNDDQYSRISIKKIVAYSLLKQIEMESEEYNCNEQYRIQIRSDHLNGDKSKENHESRRDFEEDAWTHIEDTNLYISSVNIDKNLDPYHYIRIIGVVKGSIEEPPVCQIELRTGHYRFMKSTIKPIWYDEWDSNDTNQYYNPVLLSCRIPFNETVTGVSITTKPCEIQQTSTFLLNDTVEDISRNFAVCVKPLDFREDLSHHLVQWIEILRILGADRIDFYLKRLTNNSLKVLKWYTENYPAFVDVRIFQPLPSKLTRKSSNYFEAIWQRRRYEIVAYNNCFYRNLASSKFVIPLDIDEIIMPKTALTWNNLLQHISQISNIKDYASLTVSNAYFFSQKRNKKSIFFLENLLRNDFSPVGESGKSFINTKNTVSVFNHYALNVTPGVDRVFFVPTQLVQMNHYKFNCDINLLPQCANYTSSPKIVDTSILRLKSKFLVNYNQVMTELKKLSIL